MSRTRTATLVASDLPDVTHLNRALRDQPLERTVDPAWGDDEYNGYLACTVDGEENGFELHRSTRADDQRVLSVRWGGEQAAAIAVLSALAGLFGAEVADPPALCRLSAGPTEPYGRADDARGDPRRMTLWRSA